MGCIGCSCSTGKDNVSGCRSNGGCATGGCNRHNTYDWITASGIADAKPFEFVEVSFKNGSRKEFFKNPSFTRATTGDWVVVESTSGGFDIGKVSLSGELVRLQMKRKRIKNEAKLQGVVRKAHERDLERLDEVRQEEKSILIQARAIARTLDLNMKIGDVEFQGDGRKCTFYYTAEGRVDFRELIRHYARDFKVKIEMRQIGARQESARIGGLGNCGRELCCSTWLHDFKSVNTAAARYQNLAINQTKLSGMCGRLKCCLNYELDTYIDALEDFPDRAEKLRTGAGLAILIKTDVFKRLMYYTYADDRSKFYAIHVDQIWEALDMIKNGKNPASLDEILAMAPAPEVEDDEPEPDFENVHDVIQLPIEKRKKKKKNRKKNRDQSAAAAVEKAAREDEFNGRQGGGRNDRNKRPEQRSQQGRNQQGNPNQPQRPPQNQGNGGQQKGGGNNNPQRPPQQQNNPKQGGGNNPQRPPQQQNNPKQGGGNNPQRPPQQNNPKQGGGQQTPKPPQDDHKKPKPPQS